MDVDSNGIEYKYVDLEQFDTYDDALDRVGEDYFRPIGALLVTFSELESTIDGAIAFIVHSRSDSMGLSIAALLEYGQKVDLYKQLALGYLHNMAPAEKQNLKELCKRLKSAGEVRNIIAHAKWMSLTKDGFVRSRTRVDSGDGRVKFLYHKLTPSIMEGLTAGILTAYEDFYDFIENMELI